MISPQRAVELGLVDAVARWSDLGDWLSRERGMALVAPPAPPAPEPDEHWGRPPVVAVVYAVGACAMDRASRDATTSAYLRAMAHDPDVAAVVLRADSPGGDPLPSDLVAGAIRELRDAGQAGDRQPGRRGRVGRLLDQHGRRRDLDDAADDHRLDRRDRGLGVGQRRCTRSWA